MYLRYPAIEPYETGLLEIDGQQIYWECSGNPDGIAALIVHGGPGGGSHPTSRRYFDPERYRIIAFDQRGCGKSRPLASEVTTLANNTTAHLIADMDKLRELLGVERWVLHGSSWGSTLSLAYAQRYPERVRAIVLGAVTTGAHDEIEWITRDVGRIFPEEWERFVAPLADGPDTENIPAAYNRLLMDPDPALRERAARAWCRWEDVHVSLMPGAAASPAFDDPGFRMVFARLVTHYWGNDCFLADHPVLEHMDALAGIPGVLIHGRFDVSGPAMIAWKVHRAWPGSQLHILDDAGHGGGAFPRYLLDAFDRLS